MNKVRIGILMTIVRRHSSPRLYMKTLNTPFNNQLVSVEIDFMSELLSDTDRVVSLMFATCSQGVAMDRWWLSRGDSSFWKTYREQTQKDRLYTGNINKKRDGNSSQVDKDTFNDFKSHKEREYNYNKRTQLLTFYTLPDCVLSSQIIKHRKIKITMFSKCTRVLMSKDLNRKEVVHIASNDSVNYHIFFHCHLICPFTYLRQAQWHYWKL